jgi:HD superfamily phosphodiesterase
MAIETDVMQAVARHAEEIMGSEGFLYVCAVVANCKMLALELEASDTPAEGEDDGQSSPIDIDALVMAGYLHDISTVEHGFQDHQVKSAEMADTFLQGLKLPAETIEKVKTAILTHTMVADPEQHAEPMTEGRILYDADKLGRLSGLAIVTSLIEFGARYPNRAVTGEVLAAILRHVEERFIELYQSLNTEPARNMSREKFHHALAFLDGVIEHLTDATPV